MRFDRMDLCVAIGFLALAMVCGCESGRDPGLISTPPTLPAVGTTQIVKEGDFEIHVKLIHPTHEYPGCTRYTGEVTIYYPVNWEVMNFQIVKNEYGWPTFYIAIKTPLGIKTTHLAFYGLAGGRVQIVNTNESIMWKRKFLEVKK